MSSAKAMEKTDLQADRLQRQGLAKAAERYKKAMQDTKSRDLWIEDYLPLVKSIVSRTVSYTHLRAHET